MRSQIIFRFSSILIAPFYSDKTHHLPFRCLTLTAIVSGSPFLSYCDVMMNVSAEKAGRGGVRCRLARGMVRNMCLPDRGGLA